MDKGDRIAESLKAKARAKGLDSQDVLRRYALERLACRLFALEDADSSEATLMVKGGLLWWWDDGMSTFGRATSDIDIHAFTDASHEKIIDIFRRAASLDLSAEDGVIFQIGRPTPLEHVHSEQPGIRIPVAATLGRTRINVHGDVGIGGTPPEGVETFRIAAMVKDMSTATVRRQPWAYVAAEKLHAIVDKGLENTRLKDYRDLYVLAGCELDPDALSSALRHTFEERATEIPQVTAEGLTGAYAEARQEDWARFLRKSRLEGTVPASLSEVVSRIEGFAAPIFRAAAVLSHGSALSGATKA